MTDREATLGEVETTDLICELIDSQEPFVHVRFGDGDVMFATGVGSKITGDGEEWTPELAVLLRQAWQRLVQIPNLLLGDVESYDVSDGCEPQWHDLLDEARDLRGGTLPMMVHMEALRAGRPGALAVYDAIARDGRRKALVAPERLADAAAMLDADHIAVPLREAHTVSERVARQVAAGGYDVALFCAGRGGKITQGLLADTDITQVDVGSGLDIMFTDLRRGTDRGLDPAQIRNRYRKAGLKC